MRHVYILKCSDETFYTGISNDVEKRLHAHNHSTTGARYTKSRRPVELIRTKRVRNKVFAMKLEYKIKRLSRAAKAKLIN